MWYAVPAWTVTLVYVMTYSQTSITQLERLVERIKQERSDLVAIMKSVYNRECVDGISSSDVVSKIDSVIREKSDLVLEIEDLQRSVSPTWYI